MMSTFDQWCRARCCVSIFCMRSAEHLRAIRRENSGVEGPGKFPDTRTQITVHWAIWPGQIRAEPRRASCDTWRTSWPRFLQLQGEPFFSFSFLCLLALREKVFLKCGRRDRSKCNLYSFFPQCCTFTFPFSLSPLSFHLWLMKRLSFIFFWQTLLYGSYSYLAAVVVTVKCLCRLFLLAVLRLFPGLFFSWVNIVSPCCRWSPHHVIYEAKALKCFIFIGHIFSSPPPSLCLAIYQVACFMQFPCCFCPSPTCPHFVENISLFTRELIATVAGCRLLGGRLLGGRLLVAGCWGVASYHKSSNTFTSIQSFVPFPLTTPHHFVLLIYASCYAALVLRQTH